MRGAAGFSLVEVMCAVLILGVGLAGLTHGITTALVSSKESEIQTTAALIAAGQIETLRSEGFVIEGETEGDCGDILPLYQWTQVIERTSLEGLYDVQVSVQDSKSGKTIYELKTLIFDPPLLSSLDTNQSGRAERSTR